MPSFAALDRNARVWVVCIIAVGVALVPMAWLIRPIAANQVGTLLYLGIGTQIAALLPIRWTHRNQYVGNQYVYDPLLVAAGLYAPGSGVALIAWLALFDRRVPGRDAPWWSLTFARANTAIDHIIPSLAITLLPSHHWWTLPVQTVVYSVLGISLNYSVTARALSFVYRTPFVATLDQNVGIVALSSTAILYFSGGILFLLIQTPIGMIMAPGLFGFLLAVRANVADVQRQTELTYQTLELLAQALDKRDRYTESHSKSVGELARRLGERLDLGDRECEALRMAGSLHDIGKIGVRDDILKKPGPLTDEEWEIMREHPDMGADMIAQHSALADLAPTVRHHHERWDGSGYPAGLRGDAIPFGARILSVADAFDTITGTRLYRRSVMNVAEGVEDISRRAGQWYDPIVVNALRTLHGTEPLKVEEEVHAARRITAARLLRTNPGFARLLIALGFSALGDPLTQVAALVSIYAATNRDPRAVALAFIAQALGTILMSGALGGIVDRFPRRGLMVALDLTRATLLCLTPIAIVASVWLIVPVLFVLSAINAVVQPARQAAIPGIVADGQVGRANAMASATSNACNALGFALAGILLVFAQRAGLHQPTTALFIGDGLTFAVAAGLVIGIRTMGGGFVATRITGSLRRAWSISAARAHLIVAGMSAFLLATSFPALLALAYRLNSSNGGQTYSALEVVVSAGVFAGAVAIGRGSSIGSMRTAGFGLLLTGLFALLMTMHPSTISFVATALFIASVGNAIYTVANQTALVEAADASNRGAITASRFGIVQTAMIAGSGAGGLITQAYGPLAAYGVLAIGLILLGMFAVAAGRQPTNPLLGRVYEEAALIATSAPSQAK